MSVLHDIAHSCNVGQEDIIHRAMKFQIGLLPWVLIWGIVMETLFAVGYVKQFDMAAAFTAILAYEGGVAALLTSGTAALFFRKTTGSDGSTTETIATGKQPDVTNNVTVIQP